MIKEELIWKGTPSQVTNMGTFIFTVCCAFLPLPYALYKWLKVKTQVFEITSERVKNRSGILSKSVDTLELYRVRDYSFEQPLFLRMFGLGNIKLETTDKSHPVFMLNAVKDPEHLSELIRGQVEACKQAKKVREVDVA